MSIRIQISKLQEQGLPAEEIAKQLDLDVRTVELELFRLGELTQDDIPEADFRLIRDRLIHIAQTHEDVGVASKVGMFLYEQKRGSAKSRQLPPMSLTQINNAFAAASERIEAAFTKVASTVIPSEAPGPKLSTPDSSISNADNPAKQL